MARPPSAQPNVPGKPVVARYGTPNLADRLHKVRKDSRLADYEVPAKGSTYKGPNAHKFRDFKFATLTPAPDQAEWFDWYYINERANQDEYNYKIEFPGGDKTVPKITRTYLFLREDYVEIADDSVDPVYGSGKILVDRIVTRSEDEIIDSLFIMVSRVYETLPGVPLVEKKIGQANLIPEKYRRLVKDITTRQPVEANYTFPDELVGNEAEVKLAQDTVTRARLEILEEIIGIGDPLHGNELDKWGTLDIYESIVTEGDPIDTGYLIVASKVTPLGNGLAIKITVQYPPDLADTHEFVKTLGQTNLIPEKYRRLVHHIEDDSFVEPDYIFPDELTGDQASIEFVQENLARARLKITEEVIDVDLDPLYGEELDTWGALRIYESIVEDETPIDEGYLILKSTVTPLGNGKSVKITVKYPEALATELIRQFTLGQSNLIPEKYRSLVAQTVANSFVDPATYVFPSNLTGDQTEVSYIEEQMDRARLKITEEFILVTDALAGYELDKWGMLVILESIVDDGTLIDTGFLVLKSSVTPLGNGKSIKITVYYPGTLAAITRTDKTIGQTNLIPEKYRGLVQHNEANTFVNPNSYSFPTVLTGDQTQIELVQEQLDRARLKIVEEVIGTGIALDGKEHDRWGTLSIAESIVNDGASIDNDFFVLKSSVTPLGNGKSVKITVNYPANLASQTRTDKSLGQDNLIPEKYRGLVEHNVQHKFVDPGTYTFPTALSGDQTKVEYIQEILNRARLDITSEIIGVTDALVGRELGIFGAKFIIEESLVTDGTALDTGFLVYKSQVTPLGNGKSIKISVILDDPDDEYPLIESRLWDENMRQEYDVTEQLVPAGSSEDAAPGGAWGWSSEVQGIDAYRSKKINTLKNEPAYTDEASAFISYKMEPFRFPGYLQFSGFGYYVRQATAVLVLHKIRTWWVQSPTAPTTGGVGSGSDVEFDQIITDDIIINNLSNTGLDYARSVLHDDLQYGAIFWPATTPTATEYSLGAVTGSVVLNIVSIVFADTGYVIGSSISFSGDGGSYSGTVTSIGGTGSIGNFTPISGSFGWTTPGTWGPYADAGGAEFSVWAVSVPTYDGNSWIGAEHVIGASVVPEKEKDIYRVTTEAVVMR